MHSGVTVTGASCTSSAIFGRVQTAAHRHKPDNGQKLFWLAMKYLTELIISNSWPAAGDICHFNRRRRQPSKNEKLISGCFPLCFWQWKADWKNSGTVPVWACCKFCRVRCQNSQSQTVPAVCVCAICPFSPPVLHSSAQVCNILIAQWAAPGPEEVLKTSRSPVDSWLLEWGLLAFMDFSMRFSIAVFWWCCFIMLKKNTFNLSFLNVSSVVVECCSPHRNTSGWGVTMHTNLNSHLQSAQPGCQ